MPTPNEAKLSLEKLDEDRGKTFRRLAPDEPGGYGVHRVVVEEIETGSAWLARYCPSEDDNPDYCRALEWHPAEKITVEQWVMSRTP